MKFISLSILCIVAIAIALMPNMANADVDESKLTGVFAKFHRKMKVVNKAFCEGDVFGDKKGLEKLLQDVMIEDTEIVRSGVSEGKFLDGVRKGAFLPLAGASFCYNHDGIFPTTKEDGTKHIAITGTAFWSKGNCAKMYRHFFWGQINDDGKLTSLFTTSDVDESLVYKSVSTGDCDIDVSLSKLHQAELEYNRAIVSTIYDIVGKKRSVESTQDIIDQGLGEPRTAETFKTMFRRMGNPVFVTNLKESHRINKRQTIFIHDCLLIVPEGKCRRKVFFVNVVIDTVDERGRGAVTDIFGMEFYNHAADIMKCIEGNKDEL